MEKFHIVAWNKIGDKCWGQKIIPWIFFEIVEYTCVSFIIHFIQFLTRFPHPAIDGR